MKWIASAFVWILLGASSAGKNVLVIDTVASLHRLTTAVAERGYNVTTMTCTPMKNVPENVHIFQLEKFYALDIEPTDISKLSRVSSWTFLLYFFIFTKNVEKRAFESKALREVMNYPTDFQFDLIIYDYFSPASMLGRSLSRGTSHRRQCISCNRIHRSDHQGTTLSLLLSHLVHERGDGHIW